MLPTDRNIEKYLAKYSAINNYFSLPNFQSWLQQREITAYEHLLVIPAFDESSAFLQRLSTLAFSGRLLLILVINAPERANTTALQKNTDLLQWLQKNQISETIDSTNTENIEQANRHFFSLQANLDVLAVDAFTTHGLRYGVGEARKIGCDIGLQLISTGLIKKPILFTTDADAYLPSNYFELNLTASQAAAICEFEHIANSPLQIENESKKNNWQREIILYEIHLRHYVTQLKHAGSPFAFHTIGSLLAISAKHYAQARGFPLREAGEDFYLLNKLAKLGEIITRKDAVIRLETRPSDRVPFGTGPALQQIAALPNAEEEYLFYHPLIFAELKAWLAAIPQFYSENSIELPAPIKVVLSELGVFEQIKNAKIQFKTLANFNHAVLVFFDGFKTLKTVHALRKRCYPSINWRELAQHYQINATEPSQLLAYLQQIENQ